MIREMKDWWRHRYWRDEVLVALTETIRDIVFQIDDPELALNVATRFEMIGINDVDDLMEEL